MAFIKFQEYISYPDDIEKFKLAEEILLFVFELFLFGIKDMKLRCDIQPLFNVDQLLYIGWGDSPRSKNDCSVAIRV